MKVGFRVHIEPASVAKQVVQAQAWETIRREVGSLSLGPNWTRAYHAQSMTVQNRKKGITVKVTLDGYVFMDEARGQGEFVSEKHKAGTVALACAKAVQLLQAHA
jgi:hypothetical protein